MHSPFPLFDPPALRALEVRGTAHCVGDAFALMARAGQAGWRCVLKHWPQAIRIVIVCGPGNNGGDGYVLARHAHAVGRQVRVLQALPPATELARRASAECIAEGVPVDAGVTDLPGCDLIVDALFGIGLARAPEGPMADLIAAINAHPAPVLALDVPSGIDASRGSAPGVAIQADRTLQFLARHRGLRSGAALDHCGELEFAALDLPEALLDGIAPTAFAYRPAMLPAWFPLRPRDSHKGRNGHVLCVGGNHGSGGAIVLATQAALRSGAGLVSAATRGEHIAPLLARCPEAMAHEVEDATCLHVLIETDAGQRLRPDDIVTPHPGEAARLLGCTTVDVQMDRFAAASALQQRLGCVVVLKGAGSLVQSADAAPAVICAGNPGMGTGGMGDLLTGCIASLRAQGFSSSDAATVGALLHAAAGDAAAREDGERGLLPSDLLPWLRRLANPVRR